jgi:hypothetical protein
VVVGAFLLLVRIHSEWPVDFVAVAAATALSVSLARRYRYARAAILAVELSSVLFAVLVRTSGNAAGTLAIGLAVLTIASALLHLIGDPSRHLASAEPRSVTAPIDLGVIGAIVIAALAIAARIAPTTFGSVPLFTALCIVLGLAATSLVVAGLLEAYRNTTEIPFGRFPVWKQFSDVTWPAKPFPDHAHPLTKSVVRIGNASVKIALRLANFIVAILNAAIRSIVRIANGIRRAIKVTAVRLLMAATYGARLAGIRLRACGRSLARSARIVSLGIAASTACMLLLFEAGARAYSYVFLGSIPKGLAAGIVCAVGSLVLAVVVVWTYTGARFRDLLGSVARLFELGVAGALAMFVLSAWLIGLTRSGRPLHVGLLTLVATPALVGIVLWTLAGSRRSSNPGTG